MKKAAAGGDTDANKKMEGMISMAHSKRVEEKQQAAIQQRQDYQKSLPKTRKKIIDKYNLQPDDIRKWPDGGYSIELPSRQSGLSRATGKTLQEAAYQFEILTGRYKDPYDGINRI